MFKTLLISCVCTFAFALPAFSQSSCSCSVGNGGCSASQSCPAPMIAVCSCGASGCSSYCNGGDPPDGLTESGISKAVKSSDPKRISDYLSKALAKNIVFTNSSPKAIVNEKLAVSKSKSHWDLLEYLNTVGKVTVNGQDIAFWNGMRNTVTNGGPFKICAGNATAQAILTEINFVSGRNFRIIGGDSSNRMEGAVEGNNLAELVSNLSMTRSVMISDK